MDQLISFFQQLLDPEKLIHTGGLIVVLLVIFAENGVFFGFFLPGDTLLFTAGLLTSTDKFDVPLVLLLSTLLVAAVAGSLFGYLFGLKTGDQFKDRKENIFFRKRYIEAAEAFFNKYGGRALVLGRFLPIIRTFAPIFAGIAKVNFKEYFIYNVVGGILWVVTMTMAGYYLGKIIPNAKDYLEYIILGIMVVTWIPVIITYLKDQKNRKLNA